MQTIIGTSSAKNAADAVKEATMTINNPSLIIFLTPYDILKDVNDEIKAKYGDVPSIGTSATSYYETTASDANLIVIAFGSDAKVSAGILRHLSNCPMYDVMSLEDNIAKVSPGNDDSVCLEFCTGNEEILVTSMNVALEKNKVPLVGGTVFGVPAGETAYVCANGVVYEDACCYAIIKNTSGKIRTYSENIYCLRNDAPKHIATKVNLANKELVSLDNRSAAEVYADEFNLSKSQIVDNVLENPLGRIVGDEVYICSQYDIGEKGSLVNYKKINENDTISFLQLGDYTSINEDTRRQIRSDSSKISFVFSVNCIYRHLLFTQKNHLTDFMKDMRTLGPHVGVVGGGEQYKNQHVNQTMVCAVFE